MMWHYITLCLLIKPLTYVQYYSIDSYHLLIYFNTSHMSLNHDLEDSALSLLVVLHLVVPPYRHTNNGTNQNA